MPRRKKLKQTKGQGSVYRDPKSRNWYISYWNGWRQVRESARTEDRDEALATLQRHLGDIATGKSAGPERIKVAALLALLVEDYREHDRASTYNAKLLIGKYLRPHFGNLRAVQLNTGHIKAYIQSRKNQDVSNATVNRELALLARSFVLGSRQDPPLVLRQFPKYAKLAEGDARSGFLEDAKYRTLLEQLPEELRLLYVFGCHIGMRKSALLGIKWDQIDFAAKVIRMGKAKASNKQVGRLLPIYGDMGPMIEMQPRTSPWLFSRGSRRIKDFTKAWKSACIRAGVPGLLFHDLRRTAVRNLRRAGVDPEVIMRITGHRTQSMFARYNIVDESDIRDAGRKAEAYRDKMLRVAESHTEPFSDKPS